MVCKYNAPGCNTCGCPPVDCYVNDEHEIGNTEQVNEIRFVLDNIPDDIELWTWEGQRNIIGGGFQPEQYTKWKFKFDFALTPRRMSLFEGTYDFERGPNCSWPAFGFGGSVVFDQVACDAEVYRRLNIFSTSLTLIRTLNNVVATVGLNFIFNDSTPFFSGGRPGDKPLDWYLHYVATQIQGFISNPIAPDPSSQDTCGVSQLVWRSEPFFVLPYPFPQQFGFTELDWSAYRQDYAVGSTAESFP